ncbi:unnamed protein product, partial [Aphanomyces euteiches]
MECTAVVESSEGESFAVVHLTSLAYLCLTKRSRVFVSTSAVCPTSSALKSPLVALRLGTSLHASVGPAETKRLGTSRAIYNIARPGTAYNART